MLVSSWAEMRMGTGKLIFTAKPDESYVDPDQTVRVLEARSYRGPCNSLLVAPTSLGTTARTRGCIGFNSNFSDLPFAMG